MSRLRVLGDRVAAVPPLLKAAAGALVWHPGGSLVGVNACVRHVGVCVVMAVQYRTGIRTTDQPRFCTAMVCCRALAV